MKKCHKCKQHILNVKNKCSCKLYVITDKDGDNYMIYSTDHKSAAIKHTEQSNASRDYCLMNERVKIDVNGKLFIVSTEPNIHYSAMEDK